MQDIQIVSANLSNVVFQSFLYGFLVLLFLATIYFLAMRRTLAGTTHTIRRNFASPPFVAVAVLFCLVTVYWAIVVHQVFLTFIGLGTIATEAAFYQDLVEPTEIGKEIVTCVSVLVGDALVIYRLWIIWGRSRNVVIFPVLALIGFTVAFAGSLVELARLRGRLFPQNSLPWETTGFTLNLLGNLYSTGCIIWKVSRSKHSSESRLTWFLSILVESAALQTSWLLFTMITLLYGSPLTFIALENLNVVTGIANTLIHVRVGLGCAHEHVHVHDFGPVRLKTTSESSV
ncbi:hypothetical protein FB45DRAFT_942997 [Roridomyces roridus]|uniref:Uncharacterized protein n=1 Tax=Roridomyces roridus TaxID=1738132 RepID=A0AAD7FB05_9AGAR|nr:hypothetical protein FB45DRAFT_942997 [Roridomyces roridus]